MDDLTSKQIAYTRFFESEGYKDFEARIRDYVTGAQVALDKQLSDWVSEPGVSRINYLMARRNAFRDVLDVKRQMLDEVELTKEEVVEGEDE